jgi:trehalose 6-phosphate synthase/phosphatase
MTLIPMTGTQMNHLSRQYRSAARRILFLDYDGTLAPFHKDPSKAKAAPHILNALRTLSCDTRTDIVIISGRDRGFLTCEFRGIPVTLVAEHGYIMKNPRGPWKLLSSRKPAVSREILSRMESLCRSVPGSFLEVKEASAAWHYRDSDPQAQAGNIEAVRAAIRSIPSKYPGLEVLEGNKIMEVKRAGYDKGTAASLLLAQKEYNFILAAGDDRTDEDLFRALKDRGHTVKIGTGRTCAKYRLPSQSGILGLLTGLPGKSPD